MSAAEQQKNAAAIEVLEKRIGVSPALQPTQFIRGLARQWKRTGGTTAAGKARHSDRYLDDLLRAQGTPVRSLIPKLGGRTNLKPADASVLTRFFLSHWHYVGAGSGEIGDNSADLYQPFCPDDEIDQVSRYVAEHIAKAQYDSGRAVEFTSRAFRRSSGTKQRSEHAPHSLSDVPLRSMKEVMVEEFKEATAVLSVGAGQTLLNTRPELRGFKEFINDWWEIDKGDSRQRILIWTLDLGRLDLNDPESRRRFMNVSALRSRFKALETFVEPDAEARWEWLQSKTVIVLHDTRHVRPIRPMLPMFDTNHVLFSAIPPRWAGSREFDALYTRDRLQETTHTVFLTQSSKEESLERSNPLPETPEPMLSQNTRDYELRYFGHGFMGKDSDEPKSVKLGTPGWSYADALGTVFLAAAEFLKLPGPSQVSIEGMRIDRTNAIEKLHHQGFVLLGLDRFMKNY